jgi:hypothetical protein
MRCLPFSDSWRQRCYSRARKQPPCRPNWMFATPTFQGRFPRCAPIVDLVVVSALKRIEVNHLPPFRPLPHTVRMASSSPPSPHPLPLDGRIPIRLSGQLAAVPMQVDAAVHACRIAEAADWQARLQVCRAGHPLASLGRAWELKSRGTPVCMRAGIIQWFWWACPPPPSPLFVPIPSPPPPPPAPSHSSGCA